MANDPKILPSSGIATTQQPQQAQPKRKGTGFTNLQRILQASQGSKLGQTIAGGITSQAQQVQSGVKSAQEEFNKKLQDEANTRNEQRRNEIIQTAASGEDIEQVNPNAYGDFKRYLSGEYRGPMQLENQQQLATQAQQAEALGTLASGVGSRSGTGIGDKQQLLRRFAGGADYTSGQRKLDESILARDPNANLAAAARQTRGIAQEAQRAASTAQAKAQEHQNLAGIFAKDTATRIDEAQTPISQKINEKVQQARNIEIERNTFIDDLNKQLKSNAILGLSPKQSADSLINLLKQDEYKKYIPSDIINLLTNDSDNFINRAVAVGKDPSNILLNSILASSKVAENISRQGLAASDEEVAKEGKKLDLLNKLLQKPESDLEFSQNTSKYKAGTVGTSLNPFKKEVYTGEKDKQIQDRDLYHEKANRSRDQFMNWTSGIWSELVHKNPDGTVRLSKQASKSLKSLKGYINEYNKQILNENKSKQKINELNSYLKQIEDEDKAQAIKELENK